MTPGSELYNELLNKGDSKITEVGLEKTRVSRTYRSRLEAALAKHGYEVRRPEETLTYGYHDPFATPNLLRRNEVGLYVAKKRTWTV